MPFMRAIALLLFCVTAAPLGAADIRLGIIGTDTSHVSVFSKAFNDSLAPGIWPGATESLKALLNTLTWDVSVPMIPKRISAAPSGAAVTQNSRSAIARIKGIVS